MSVSFYFGDHLPDRPPIELDTSSPFRILVLADLGNSIPWGKPLSVDRDDLDDVLARLGVQVAFQLQEQGPEVVATISRFDDFHPDQLFANMDLFKAFREQRKRVANSATFPEEILLSQAAYLEQQSKNREAELLKQERDANESSLLNLAIDLAQARQIPLVQQIVQGTVDWDDYVRQLAAPHLIEKADPRQAEMLENIDEAITTTMRQTLRHPRFQQIEGTWAGIRMLTDRLDTNRTLQITVVNVSQQVLTDDLMATDDLSKSQLHKLLVEQPQGEEEQPWSLVLGDYQFEATPEQTQTLGRVARVCAAAGTAFVAGALPAIVGCSGFDSAPDCEDWATPSAESCEAWAELRSLPESKWISLGLPRILGRRVYGRETDPIEAFAFEELPDGSLHQGFLWVNAAFGIALLHGQAFSEVGWDLGNVGTEIKRLPIHYYVDEGEECIQACAEAYLVDRCAEKLSKLGLTVARSVKNEGEVRFEGIKSLSSDSPEWPVCSRR